VNGNEAAVGGIPKPPPKLLVGDEVLSACRTDLVDYVASAAPGRATGGVDRKLLAAQLYLLVGARRPAVAALEAISGDPSAYAALSGFTLRSGDELEMIFTVNGDAYRYFYALYNHTWRNERHVEIPIAERFLREHPGETLEIGNVMGHYFSHNHAVVDKYENAQDTVHADILDYFVPEPFDTILSISTLEHIGRDHVRDEAKTVRVYRHIVDNLLAGDGAFMFTVPIGFNGVLDGYIDNHTILPDEHFCLKRTSEENDWVQVEWNEAKKSRYMSPFHCANALYIGFAYGKNRAQKSGGGFAG
jgi:hypothetical protein